MKNTLQTLFVLISLLIIILFIVFVINQTAQVVSLAHKIHPILALTVFWFLMVVYLLLVAIPIWIYLRMPPVLKPPENEQGEAFDLYLKQLSARLKKNIYLKEIPLKNHKDIEKAIKILNKDATGIIKETASTVFVVTAISQSGRLDAFTVLVALIRMVWKVSRVYNQRPSLGEMAKLYANVAATTFIASELDDIDVSRQVEPIVGSVLGASLSSAIPGVHMMASVVTNSLLVGAANAYLVLRVGAITKKYSGSLVKMEQKKIRVLASVEAARLLSLVVVSMAGSVSKAIMNAAVKRPGKFSKDFIKSTWDKFAGNKKIDSNESLDFKEP